MKECVSTPQPDRSPTRPKEGFDRLIMTRPPERRPAVTKTVESPSILPGKDVRTWSWYRATHVSMDNGEYPESDTLSGPNLLIPEQGYKINPHKRGKMSTFSDSESFNEEVSVG